MKIKTIMKILLAIVCVAIYAYSAFYSNHNQSQNVVIDASMPVSIEWPCEISIVGTTGQKGLRIGAGIGRGWRNEAGGKAVYKFYIPETGKYYLWGYCLWFDECANAVFVKIDNSKKAILGNDPIYQQWHWLSGFAVELTHGTHTIELSNHSDHIAIQKLMFIKSAVKTPQGCDIVFSDIFYEGFDGCDRGNFSQWQIVSGQWSVEDPTQNMCFSQNSLKGHGKNKAMILYNNEQWSDYSFTVEVKSADSAVGVCFAVKDEKNYFQLICKPNQDGYADIEICRVADSENKIIDKFQATWKQNRFNDIEILLTDNTIEISINGKKHKTVNMPYQLSGGIGLLVPNAGLAWFDNIHIRKTSRGQ